MNKKRILFISSIAATDTQLRVIDEIGVIEPLLLSGENRDDFNFITKLTVQANNLTKTIIGNASDDSPFILHFSLHGNQNKGLKFVGNNLTINYQNTAFFEDILSEMIIRNQKIKCVIFNACHSLQLAQSIIPFVDYAIGVQGFIADRASIEFSRGFYSQLFDNNNEAQTFESSFRVGLLYIRQWMRDENIQIEDEGVSYDKRFQLFCKP